MTEAERMMAAAGADGWRGERRRDRKKRGVQIQLAG